MAISKPSKRIAVVDTPEPSNFMANFVYNFFTADEQLNDSGHTSVEFIEEMPSANFDNKFLDSFNFNRFTPRYVKLIWNAVPFGNRPEIANKISIADNIEKIHNEQTFTTDEYTNVFFQDTNLGKKYKFFINRFLKENNAPIKGMSVVDMTKYVNDNTTEHVNGNFLSEILTDYNGYGYTFSNAAENAPNEKTILETLNSVSIRTQLNNKFLAALLKTTSKNLTNIFDNGPLETAVNIQEKARTQNPSTIIEGKDYDFEIFDIVDYKVIDPTTFDSTVQVVGYLIDKVEITPAGEIKQKPIVIESSRASSTVDLKIKYGSTYAYTLRAITLIEVAAEDSERDGIIAVSFLVASRRSPRIIVKCVEEQPPPPVADFNVAWDYSKNAARLLWSFPVNSQRDIKYFQVFRRKDISSPFELIKMYDFNDSLTPINLIERVDREKIQKVLSPVNIFIDREFTKNSRYIYTICSVDAHGFSSNYGIQFECFFDSYQNKLIKKLISLSGAPKPYPNFYLQKDAFIDSIKTSGSKRLRVIFNPEYLKIVNRQGNDLKLLKTGSGSNYKLHMINVDLQREQTLNISIKDMRTSEYKNKSK